MEDHEEPKIAGILTKRDEQIQEELKGYIFNENEVLLSVPFSQFLSKDGRLCFGLLLPKEVFVEKTNSTRQIWQPIVLTSERTFHPVFESNHRALGVNFQSTPRLLPKRYKFTIVPQWLHRDIKKVDAVDLFNAIKSAYQEYLYFSSQWYDVHACWDIATYLFMLFPAFPYLELRGMKNAAKTKVMTMSRCFAFNASDILTSPTAPVLFRLVHDLRPTLYLDECESLFRLVKGRHEPDERIEVINSGYSAGGKVPRLEKIGNRFQMQTFNTYCPKMLASINGLYGATESRAIVHIMTRAPDDDPRGETDIDESNPQWQEVREGLFAFALLKYKEVQEAYLNIGKRGKSGLKKRSLQLWRPLLAVARVIDPELEKRILSVAAQQQVISRGEELSSDSWQYVLLERMYQLIRRGQMTILYKELREVIPGERKPSSRTIGRTIGNMGFRDYYCHTQEGNGIRFTQSSEFESIASTIAPSILSDSSSSSLASAEQEFMKIDSDEMKMTEEKIDLMNFDAEHPEENEGNEAETSRKESTSDTMLKILNSRKEPYKIEKLERDLMSPTDFEQVIAHLKEIGDIFEPRPGFVQVLK